MVLITRAPLEFPNVVICLYGAILVTFNCLLALFVQQVTVEIITILFIASTRMTSWTVPCGSGRDHDGDLGAINPGISCISNVFKDRLEGTSSTPL